MAPTTTTVDKTQVRIPSPPDDGPKPSTRVGLTSNPCLPWTDDVHPLACKVSTGARADCLTGR